MYSIIIPVYNKANYITRLLDEIVNQSVEDYEVILVDDRSTDDSVAVINKYISDKPKFRLLENDINHGPAYSRNRGIEAAQGEYVLFIDSDDKIESVYLSRLNNVITEKKPDYVVFSFSEDYLDDDGKVSHHLLRTVETSEYRLKYSEKGLDMSEEADTFKNMIICLEENTMLGYPWNKVYKKSIIDEFGIRFPEDLRFGEDIFFNCDYLRHVCTMNVLSDCLYHYNNYSGVRLTSGVVADYFLIQNRRVKYIADLWREWECLNGRARNVLAAEYFRSFQSEIARSLRQGISKKTIVKMCEDAYKSDVYQRLKDCLLASDKKKKFLYGPLTKGKTSSAIRRAKMILFLQKNFPTIFSRAKGKI